MTRSENMEHVAVLRHMKETIKAIMPSEVAALDAAIAALSAPQPPAEAQQQGGWDLKEVVCLACGDHIMPMGQLCHACSHPVSEPPSAPVGVEELDAAAVEAGHITFESMKQCADAWFAVVDALNAAAPGWKEKKGTRCECATAAIAALAQQPAAVDGADAQDAEIEALRVELDRLRGEHVRVRRDRNAKAARAERLEEALRDAERYRWLRDCDDGNIAAFYIDAAGAPDPTSMLAGSQLDDDIDAAREARNG